jgi:adenylate cyclase
LESGSVVEGLLGSTNIRFYDAIGDTVNTAKRIENAAQAGQVLISERVCESK